MADEIFDGGIDLSLLADSEEGVFEIDAQAPNLEETPGADASGIENKETDSQDGGKEVFEIDENEIANLGEDDSEEDDSEDSSAKDNKDTKETPADKEPASSADTLTSLATALKEAGVFSSLEEEDLKIESTDDLFKAIEKQIKTNEYAFLNETQKEYLEALEAGVPLEKYSEVKSNVAQYENLEDEVIEKNANVTFELLRRKFIVDGASPDKALNFAKLAMKESNAVQEAKEAKRALIDYEKNLIQEEIQEQKRLKEDKVRQESEKLSQLKSKVLESSELIPGIRVNTNTKDKVFQSLTAPSDRDEDGNPLNEVMAKYKNDDDYKLKLHALHVITKGFTDFSKIEKENKSKAVKDFEEKLKSGSTVATGSATTLGATTKSIKNALDGYVPSYRKNN